MWNSVVFLVLNDEWGVGSGESIQSMHIKKLTIGPQTSFCVGEMSRNLPNSFPILPFPLSPLDKQHARSTLDVAAAFGGTYHDVTLVFVCYPLSSFRTLIVGCWVSQSIIYGVRNFIFMLLYVKISISKKNLQAFELGCLLTGKLPTMINQFWMMDKVEDIIQFCITSHRSSVF